MSLKKPLAIYSGVIAQLQAGDILDAPASDAQIIAMTNGESSAAITIGMPVYILSADNVKRAEANAGGTVPAIGLAYNASVATGTSGEFATSGLLASADWTAVTGSTTLTAGSIYYLSATTAGQLTTTAPSTVGQYVQVIGIAIDTTTMLINIKSPILL